MTETKLTFKRYEKKYILRPKQYEAFRAALDPYICPDIYFSSTVCSLYYDTEAFSLIRSSIDAPIYKEKLRLRSYNVPKPDEIVFIELKEKFKGLVYKRRVAMQAHEASAYLAGYGSAPEEGQVTRELDWFLKSYPVNPRVLIACDRTAYVLKDDPEFRLTFDARIRWRDTELDLCLGSHGKEILPEDYVLMELKIPQSVPLWLARMLSEYQVFPEGFSKYGTCYQKNLINGVIFHV